MANGNGQTPVNARTFWTLISFNAAIAIAFFAWMLGETSSFKADAAALKEIDRHINVQIEHMESKLDRLIEREKNK